MQTPDDVRGNIEKIRELFPSCVTETTDKDGTTRLSVDFERLRQELSDEAVDGREERYQMTWPGKRNAVLLANAPVNAALRPCREESVDFDTTHNLYIEGDNLDVLKCLKETYLGKVKMIYIDPPYNTGNDFVYHDDFASSIDEYMAQSGQYDEQGNRLVTNSDSNGRFHTDWLNMIYPRLKVARDLLAEDGYICISIDDNEYSNVHKIADEIFGESNCYATFIIIRSEGGGLAKKAVIGHDYLIVYTKNYLNALPLGRPKDIRGEIIIRDGEEYWVEKDWFREVFGKYGTCHYEDILCFYNKKKKEEIDKGLKEGKYILIQQRDGKHIVGRFRKVSEDTSKFYTVHKFLNKYGMYDLNGLNMTNYFDYAKPVSLIKEFIMGSTIHTKNKNDIILDFFSGSATTAHAVMQLNAEDGGNRRYIMVQIPEACKEDSEAAKAGYKTICEIGKERIRRAGKKILEELAAKREKEGMFKDENAPTLDTGFWVLKLDSTNMKDVYYRPQDVSKRDLFGQVDNIKEDRSTEDLLFQAMLECGVTLDSPIEREEIEGMTVYNVNHDYMLACFEAGVTDKVVTAIAKRQPQYALFRDAALANDSTVTNIDEIFKTYSNDTRRRVI